MLLFLRTLQIEALVEVELIWNLFLLLSVTKEHYQLFQQKSLKNGPFLNKFSWFLKDII